MSLNAAAIRSGRLRVVCAADGSRGREVTDEMTVTVECKLIYAYLMEKHANAMKY